MRYECEEPRPDGSIETWDIELREFKEPKFHLYKEGGEDKRHPKIKCPVCGANVIKLSEKHSR